MSIVTMAIREPNSDKPKVIGKYVEETNVFRTARDYTKHLLKKYNAWAVDYNVLVEFLLPRNSTILIIDSKRSTIYKTTAEEFYNKGEEIEFLNHRKQMYLNLDYFSKEKI